jgi:hypothetical protein
LLSEFTSKNTALCDEQIKDGTRRDATSCVAYCKEPNFNIKVLKQSSIKVDRKTYDFTRGQYRFSEGISRRPIFIGWIRQDKRAGISVINITERFRSHESDLFRSWIVEGISLLSGQLASAE